MRFSVTFNVVTAESAENGEAAEDGFIVENVTLKDALAEFGPRTNECDGGHIEPNDSNGRCVRWITRRFSEYVTGDEYSVSLHYSESMTPASRARLTRAIEQYL